MVVLGAATLGATWTLSQQDVPRAVEDPTAWTEWPVAWRHVVDDEHWPWHGMAALRLDGEVVLWVGGGPGQRDVILGLRAGELEVFQELDEGPSFGAVSMDLDGDDDTDLLVARPEGLVIYWNEDGRLELEDQGVGCVDGVPVDVAVADVNDDGFADVFVSCFVSRDAFRSGVFNDPDHVAPNRLLLGAEDGWTDATEAWQLAGSENTFTASFVDLDLDDRVDLVVANDTGRIELYHHDGERYSLFGLDGYGFWMGVAVGDLDADGDQDLVFSNVGNSIPARLVRGDLTDEQPLEPRWMVVWNDGARRYRAEPLSGLGFGWGVAAGDVDSDGDLDLIGAQNDREWPLHHLLPLNGVTLLREEGAYRLADAGLGNPLFAQSPLWVDLDQDGLEDLVMSNPGSLLRAWKNPGDPSAAVTVRLPDTLDSAAARVTLRAEDGLTPTWAGARQGFMADGLADRVLVAPGAKRALIERPGQLPRAVPLD